ncbi:hypothetical protein ACIPZF_07185 [Pseudomonas sp. NPDC089752]|uniref:hypothetical protein n=1 Tax=Pseudomonas sp. NPDC089752 TaxID=3364472 RepID=UPI0038291759
MTTEIRSSGNNTAAVIEQSLLAFGAGLDAAVRADIKNAYQFASRAASHSFSSEGETEQWFNHFIKVMHDCGWVTLMKSYEMERSQSQSLKLGAVVYKTMKVVGQAVLSNPLTDALANLAADALESLGKVNQAQEIFTRNLRERRSSTVGLGACIQNEVGEVFLAMSAIDSKPFDDHQLNNVVFEWESKSSAVYSGAVVFVFNRFIYDVVRDHIRQRLTDSAVSNILDYDI